MSQLYFNKLNYSLGNEDTTLEFEISKIIQAQNVFSVCGSGGRAFPLVNKNTSKIVLCDLSSQQLYLAELREKAYKELAYDDFLMFFGYYPFSEKNIYSEQRKVLFQRLSLSTQAREYFHNYFAANNYESLLYDGKWEKTFKILARITQAILGKKCVKKLFSFNNLKDQVEYLDHSFPWKRFYLILLIVGNKSFFNSLLYKGHFVKKNINETHFTFYKNAFKKLMYQHLMSESFFLSLCFNGELLRKESNPIESSEKVFDNIKNTPYDVEYINKDILHYLSQTSQKFDLLSLSDVPSYFNDENGKRFLQEISNSVNTNGLVIIRYYLREYHPDIFGFEDVTMNYQSLIDNEKVQMYKVRIYKKL